MRPMRLPELFQLQPLVPPIDFSRFLRREGIRMPPPKLDLLQVKILAGETRKELQTVTNGDGSLVLIYKDREAAVLSVCEEDDGDRWDISQVQGARSRVSYRVAATMNTPLILADNVMRLAKHPSARVRHLTMPRPAEIAGIFNADSNNVFAHYEAVLHHLDMRFSEDLGGYVSDLVR